MSQGPDAARAAAFLEGLIRQQGADFGARASRALADTTDLLAAMDHPERGLAVIHIAGSKGKGSTALCCEAILKAAGLGVGTFTSPHLTRWHERFRLDGSPVDDATFAATVDAVRPAVADLQRRRDRAPGFFAVVTAAALGLFRRANVDVAVVETGIGGRRDATNVLTPKVSCITTIEREHVDKLGFTLEAIASEKAGIIKPEGTAVIGPLLSPAADVVARHAMACGAPTWISGRDFTFTAQPLAAGSRLAVSVPPAGLDPPVELVLPLPGHHLAQNAALAVACVGAFGTRGPDLARAAKAGLEAVVLPGRSEILSRRPWIVVDSAHTRASVAALTDVLAPLAVKPRLVVLSVSRDKDPGPLCHPLVNLADAVFTTCAEPRRSWSAEALAKALAETHPPCAITPIADPHQALATALAQLPAPGLLCVAGSVFLAGIARTSLAGDGAAPPLARQALSSGSP
ncbi:MAG: bifunctional folylpolyglutamate synthase/dihydrofolate synthase [Candidatus Competibacterales bacterium]